MNCQMPTCNRCQICLGAIAALCFAGTSASSGDWTFDKIHEGTSKAIVSLTFQTSPAYDFSFFCSEWSRGAVSAVFTPGADVFENQQEQVFITIEPRPFDPSIKSIAQWWGNGYKYMFQ